MELISPLLYTEFQEFCVIHLVIRQIDTVFSMAGVQHMPGQARRQVSGERRTRVEEYYASLDWSNAKDVQKFLNAIGYTLAQSYLSDEVKNSLRELFKREGFAVDGYRIYLSGKGVSSNVKNLIFAADGPKPEIVLIDSVSNDIEIKKNAEYCLVYDRPIFDHGLLWKELVDWYSELTALSNVDNVQRERVLYARLSKSLASEPERMFFRSYFEQFRESMGSKLPALIPQVYLHYDPYAINQLADGKRLVRQRMDFLLLFSNRDRIVIEIDGKQHYAESDKASPRLYAEMVSEDRRIRLAGYEVYRFGGFEFQDEGGRLIIKAFFDQLFRKHMDVLE
jgi:hypothetical protein